MHRHTNPGAQMILKSIQKIWQRIVGYFVAGVLAVLPLVITIAVVVWVTDFLREFIGPGTVVGKTLRSFGMNFVSNDTLAYILGWALVLAVVFGLGLLMEFGARKLLQRIVDTLLNRVPVVGSIYNTSKQLTGMLDKKDEADIKGMQAVFCFFGKDNPTGLLALLTSPERFSIAGREYFAVIVPTAPVPVGGGLIFVPADSVVPADIPIDGLMSVYVSMGVTAPEFLEVAKNGGSATIANPEQKPSV